MSDVANKTLDELLEADEDAEYGLTEEELDEMREDYEELREGAVMSLQAAAFAELFFENELTLKEYDEIVTAWEEIAHEKDVRLP